MYILVLWYAKQEQPKNIYIEGISMNSNNLFAVRVIRIFEKSFSLNQKLDQRSEYVPSNKLFLKRSIIIMWCASANSGGFAS